MSQTRSAGTRCVCNKSLCLRTRSHSRPGRTHTETELIAESWREVSQEQLINVTRLGQSAVSVCPTTFPSLKEECLTFSQLLITSVFLLMLLRDVATDLYLPDRAARVMKHHFY